MISSLRRLRSKMVSILALLKGVSFCFRRVLGGCWGSRTMFTRAFVPRDLAKAVFGVMFAYSGVALGHEDYCDERKG
jgi:hypothetical protein